MPPVSKTLGRILPGRCLAIIVMLALAGTARGQIFADWTSANGTSVSGTIGGTSITVTWDANGTNNASFLAGDFTGFDNSIHSPAAPFTPSLAGSDAFEILGKLSGSTPTYTITFGTTVVDPILLIASNASTLTFTAAPAQISGDSRFSISGNQVIGTYYSAPPVTDANGTVQFTGTFTSLSFTAIYSGPGSIDGIDFQVAVAAIPEPSTYAGLAGGTALGLALLRRRRTRAANILS